MLITLKREDIHAGNLILVNSDYAYQESVHPQSICDGLMDRSSDARRDDTAAGSRNLREGVYGRSFQGSCGQAECGCIKISREDMYDRSFQGGFGQAECGNIKISREDVYGKPVWLKQCAAHSLNRLLRELGGWRQIVPVSGWRTMKEQQHIWADSIKENGRTFTETYVAVPGHSEHQTGLAIDLGRKQEEIDFIRPDFPYYGICQRLRDRAAEYGFIERYPKGKESITGIGHEPWHFRYVGVPHAAIMKENGWTLEEYILFLREYPYGQKSFHYEDKDLSVELSYIKDQGIVTRKKSNKKAENLGIINRFCHMPEDQESMSQSNEKAEDQKSMRRSNEKTGDRISMNRSNEKSGDIEAGVIQIEMNPKKRYSISGNNIDGFIVTEISEK